MAGGRHNMSLGDGCLGGGEKGKPRNPTPPNSRARPALPAFNQFFISGVSDFPPVSNSPENRHSGRYDTMPLGCNVGALVELKLKLGRREKRAADRLN